MKILLIVIGLVLSPFFSVAQQVIAESDNKASDSKFVKLSFLNSRLISPTDLVKSQSHEYFAISEDAEPGSLVFSIFSVDKAEITVSGTISAPDECFGINLLGVSDNGDYLLLEYDCKVFSDDSKEVIYSLAEDVFIDNIVVEDYYYEGTQTYYFIKGEYGFGAYTGPINAVEEYAKSTQYVASISDLITIRNIKTDEIVWESPKQKYTYYDEGADLFLDKPVIILREKENNNEQLSWYDFEQNKTVYSTKNPFAALGFYNYLTGDKLTLFYPSYPSTEVLLDLSSGSFEERKIKKPKDINNYIKEKGKFLQAGVKTEDPEFKDAHNKLWDIFMDHWDGTSQKSSLGGQISANFYPETFWDQSDTALINDDWYVFSSFGNKVIYRDLLRDYSFFAVSNEFRSVNEIIFWNGNMENELHRKVNMIYHIGEGPIFYVEDNYYMSFGNLENIIGFENNGILLDFKQFDLKYNRPDIILERLGHADSELIKAYYDAYKKRLVKMGVTEDMIKEDYHLSHLTIDNFKIMQEIKVDY